uniref:Uncharacterized protein n=1 Tax=Periophthalmus magnuspinnatus TaxID=409849 RepID=A0A3B3ZDL2_9GOBI
MGKPLSRPDCLRQNPRCLGKGDEEEAYIEDCYVPQRSIYDTMRINEQIDQGTKLCQQSRSTLGSGGEPRGEGSTISSNGTIGADIGGVFVSRNTEHPGGGKRLDERVIFDALKLTGDPQIMSPPRRLQGSDKKDNPNRRSWKAFMPPSYPEFVERFEFSTEAERRQSGPGIPLSPIQNISSHPIPSTPTSSTPSIPPHTPSPLSSAPHTPPVSSPSVTEDGNTDEESLYLIDPPSPFLKEEDGIVYGGLPLSPCISHEGLDEGLLGWDANQLRERTASELKFEEDERRILAELEEEEKQNEACGILTEEEELAEREEREWEAVLKLENKDIIDQCWDKETLESEEWDLANSSGHWPLLTPPTGFGGPGAISTSPCPSSAAESDDLFLQLERQCEDDDNYEEGVEMCVDPDPVDPYDVPCLADQNVVDFEGTLPIDEVELEVEMITNNMTPNEPIDDTMEDFDLKRTQDCENEHSIIDDSEGEFEKDKIEEEEVLSYPTDSALGQQLESDSQPDGMEVIKMDSEGDKLAQTETDLDSGASSEHGDREDVVEEVGFYGTSCSPMNPYVEEQEQDIYPENSRMYDQSEPNLDSSKCLFMDQSHEDHKQEVDKQILTEIVSMETDDAAGTSYAPETVDAPSEPNSVEVTASIPQENSVNNPENVDPICHLSPVSDSDLVGAALNSKDSSEAFVVSDSFVYLAVSVPPQSPHDCPPSPFEDSVPPSPIPKPTHGTEEQDGAVLSPDSFVYMAAPERPQPGRSDIESVCEDQDLDSFSEGTQSGVDFVLGSVEGDSDWESEGSTLDFPFFNSDPVWDNIEPGLLYNLFSERIETPVLNSQEEEDSQKGSTPCYADPLPESGHSSAEEHESPNTLPRPESDTAAEVCH